MTKERTKPYGYLLVLRGLAKAAIELPDHPSALRVLCVLADYMNAQGMCRFGQGTVAARLGMTRQAVNKHLKVLIAADILMAFGPDGPPTSQQATKGGRTLEYWLNMDGMDEARAGQEAVNGRRLLKVIERGGFVALHDREGYAAFLAHTTYDDRVSGNVAKGKAAMVAAERALGIRYDVAISASAETEYIAYYSRHEIEAEQTSPIEKAVAAASEPELCDFG